MSLDKKQLKSLGQEESIKLDKAESLLTRQAETNALGALKTSLQRKVGDLLSPLAWLEPDDQESAGNMEKLFNISWPELRKNAQQLIGQIPAWLNPIARNKLDAFLNKIAEKENYSPAQDKDFALGLVDEYDALLELLTAEIVKRV